MRSVVKDAYIQNWANFGLVNVILDLIQMNLSTNKITATFLIVIEAFLITLPLRRSLRQKLSIQFISKANLHQINVFLWARFVVTHSHKKNRKTTKCWWNKSAPMLDACIGKQLFAQFKIHFQGVYRNILLNVLFSNYCLSISL